MTAKSTPQLELSYIAVATSQLSSSSEVNSSIKKEEEKCSSTSEEVEICNGKQEEKTFCQYEIKALCPFSQRCDKTVDKTLTYNFGEETSINSSKLEANSYHKIFNTASKVAVTLSSPVKCTELGYVQPKNNDFKGNVPANTNLSFREIFSRTRFTQSSPSPVSAITDALLEYPNEWSQWTLDLKNNQNNAGETRQNDTPSPLNDIIDSAILDENKELTLFLSKSQAVKSLPSDIDLTECKKIKSLSNSRNNGKPEKRGLPSPPPRDNIENNKEALLKTTSDLENLQLNSLNEQFQITASTLGASSKREHNTINSQNSEFLALPNKQKELIPTVKFSKDPLLQQSCYTTKSVPLNQSSPPKKGVCQEERFPFSMQPAFSNIIDIKNNSDPCEVLPYDAYMENVGRGILQRKDSLRLGSPQYYPFQSTEQVYQKRSSSFTRNLGSVTPLKQSGEGEITYLKTPSLITHTANRGRKIFARNEKRDSEDPHEFNSNLTKVQVYPKRFMGSPKKGLVAAERSTESYLSVSKSGDEATRVLHQSRHRLLEEVRSSRKLHLSEITGHVLELSFDQYGSRFIQQKLEGLPLAGKDLMFAEILPHTMLLVNDIFGNYVVQKFFEFGTEKHKAELLSRLTGHVLMLSLQVYGCRVIQKAFDSVGLPQQIELARELRGHVLQCIKDQNGNHVIQKCIECVPPQEIRFIVDALKNLVCELAAHPYGCRVIQRILEHCTDYQITYVLEELHGKASELTQDQYGNYVIQHVLEHGRRCDRDKIIGSMRNRVLLLSQHKFASNVVEKCLIHGDSEQRAVLISEVLKDGNKGGLHTMIKDQYANYVVQRMIDVAQDEQREELLLHLKPHFEYLKNFSYGKHIIAKVEKQALEI